MLWGRKWQNLDTPKLSMPYPIEAELVITVASSALSSLDEEDAVFRKEGGRIVPAGTSTKAMC